MNSAATPTRRLFGGIGAALSHPVYRNYWIGTSVAIIGRWMLKVAVGWLTWELTNSTVWLGIVAGAEALPLIILSLIGGAVADKFGYLRIMWVSQLLIGGFTVLFAFLVWTDLITIEGVVVLTAILGSLEAISGPARLSIVNSLVPKKDLSAAIALGSATFNVGRVAGPAIAGALIVIVNNAAVMALAALTFFVLFAILRRTHIEETNSKSTRPLNLVGDMKESVVYVWNHAGIFYLMLLLGATAFLIRPYIDLAPGISVEMFGQGALGMAILLSSTGAGGLIAGLYLAQRGETRGLTRLVSGSFLGAAIFLILFTISGHIWLAAAALVLVGFFILLGGISSQTLIQNVVDPRVRARVISLYIIISWGVPALGAMVMGWLAGFAGLQITLAGGGVLALFVWLIMVRQGPKLKAQLEATNYS
jgi:MFS family permease